MYLLDTRWKQMHNAMRVREGTVTITGSHPHSWWSFCAQGHSILSQYQASYPAILDIATSVSLNKLLGGLERCTQEEIYGVCRMGSFATSAATAVGNTGDRLLSERESH